jgi:hypothetical protein
MGDSFSVGTDDTVSKDLRGSSCRNLAGNCFLKNPQKAILVEIVKYINWHSNLTLTFESAANPDHSLRMVTSLETNPILPDAEKGFVGEKISTIWEFSSNLYWNPF